jgi:sugar lactone lactonase YvrE
MCLSLPRILWESPGERIAQENDQQKERLMTLHELDHAGRRHPSKDTSALWARYFGFRTGKALFLVLAAAASFWSLPASAAPFPETIPLPNGFRPEGIAIGEGHDFYVGSIPTGAIYKGNLRTGEGDLLVPPTEGRAAIGLAYDLRSGFLFVAGGGTGAGYVYDSETGELLDQWQFTSPPTFVNDVVVTPQGAYFTDSLIPVLYFVPLSGTGELGDPGVFEEIPLSGDFEFVEGQFNSNGIDATPDGRWLVIVNSNTGALYRVDPLTGEATQIDLGGEELTFGDGILLHGRTLYVVRNRLNEIAVIDLNPQLTAGEVVDTLTNPNFRVPTTIARRGNALYAVNARFGDPTTPDIEYDVVRVQL